MRIIKYEKVSNGNYKVYLEGRSNIVLSEQAIINHKLIYKDELSKEEFDELRNETNFYTLYNGCIRYIAYRLRSKKEMYTYLERKKLDRDLIESLIKKLEENEFIDDDAFTKAFVNDKMNFTSNGPYKIKQELIKNNIDRSIIDKYIEDIDKDLIDEKINKLIKKYLKANKKYQGSLLKNKIYTNLINLGYSSDDINLNLNTYDFNS